MERIGIEEFLNLKFISSLKISASGKNVCFVVSNGDKNDNDYKSYIYKLTNGTLTKMTSSGKERSFQYLDDETIMFAGNREKSEANGSIFYKLSLNGGEAEKYIELPISASKLVGLDNGDYLVLGQTVKGFEDLYKGDESLAKEYKQFVKDEADYEVVETNPFWWNGSTFTKGNYSSLYYYKTSEKKLERLTEVGFSVGSFEYSKKLNMIYFQGCVNKPLTTHNERSTIYSLDLDSLKINKVVESCLSFNIDGFYLLDSYMVLYAADETDNGSADGDFYKVDYLTNEISLLAKYGLAVGNSTGSDVRYGSGYQSKVVGDDLYFISTVENSAFIRKLSGNTISDVVNKVGSVDSFDVVDDKLLLVGMYDMIPEEIYDCSLNKLTDFNTSVLADKYVAVPEMVTLDKGTHTVDGFVLKPFGYEQGKKYPVIIDIHGGPKTAYSPIFYHEMQYWASLGYFVMFCNPQGSDGKGTFADITGKYGTIDFDDIMDFCDYTLAKYPDMDETNFFETGGSYGGFMTNWIIGHTDRFKACASQRSISNWFSFYGISDIGVGFTKSQNKSTVWENPEKLWFHSPLKYAENVKTPTLFIHSFEDYRCPIDQGYQMFTALVAQNVETKMVLFRGENHELSRGGKPLHRIRRIKEITEWFENHKG